MMQLKHTVFTAAFALSCLVGVDAFFRINCEVVQTGRIDPIINPGAVAPHCHTIVGGSNIGVNSTYASLFESQCTSCEVGKDKSAYWTPNLYYEHANGSFEEVPHGGSVVYYLNRGPGQDNLTTFPQGFQMVSGNKALRAYNQSGMTWGNDTYPNRPIADAISFACLSEDIGPDTYGMVNVSTCINGLRAQIQFQTCWNGVDLYKSDNSHVAYLSQIDDGVCPPGYPYQFPHIFLETNYAVEQVSNNTDGGRYVWSQGDTTGYGFHGDFMNGWDPDVLQDAIDTCMINDADPDGTIDECPILIESDSTEAGLNCPAQPLEIVEAVHGMLDKLPGCIVVTSGPEAATAADMECGAGVVQPSIVKTVDSTPLATYTPAVGQYFGNPGYEYLGCGNDTAGDTLHTVNALETTADNMTVEYCQSYCTANGYRISGLEYGTECYCDLAVNPTAQLTGNYSTRYGCMMTCPGNRSEICGGPNYMSIYNNTDPDFVSTTDLSGSVEQLTYTVLPYASNYVGCASEGTGGRALNGTSYASDAMTVEYCAAKCEADNYQYYGLEYASQCFCGNGLASNSTIVDSAASSTDSACNSRCAGNYSEICGQSDYLSVYENAAYTPTVILVNSGRYYTQGCLTEPTDGGRALTGAYITTTDMTPRKCIKYCLGQHMHYAGLEYGSQCFCGDSVAAGAVAETSCPTQDLVSCAGDRYTYCGAGSLLNLYYSATL